MLEGAVVRARLARPETECRGAVPRVDGFREGWYGADVSGGERMGADVSGGSRRIRSQADASGRVRSQADASGRVMSGSWSDWIFVQTELTRDNVRLRSFMRWGGLQRCRLR